MYKNKPQTFHYSVASGDKEGAPTRFRIKNIKMAETRFLLIINSKLSFDIK